MSVTQLEGVEATTTEGGTAEEYGVADPTVPAGKQREERCCSASSLFLFSLFNQFGPQSMGRCYQYSEFTYPPQVGVCAETEVSFL